MKMVHEHYHSGRGGGGNGKERDGHAISGYTRGNGNANDKKKGRPAYAQVMDRGGWFYLHTMCKKLEDGAVAGHLPGVVRP